MHQDVGERLVALRRFLLRLLLLLRLPRRRPASAVTVADGRDSLAWQRLVSANAHAEVAPASRRQSR